MVDDGWRMTCRLKSLQALTQFAELHGLVHPDGKINAYALGRKAGLGVATVGHIVTGRRTTCTLNTARKIEAAVGAPAGFLFDVHMSQVSKDVRYRDNKVHA